MLTLYPSLHVKGGASAYLPHSSSDFQPTEMAAINPLDRALAFEAAGFPWLHLVDLDAAFAESPENRSCIEEIIKKIKIPVQISGGIHTMRSVESWINAGAQCVVLASAAQKTPTLMREAAAKFPGKIAVKIDSIGGFVARTGWANTSALKALDLALQAEEAGVAKIIYADINLDGALSEVDLEATIDLAFALTAPVIAAGGVHSLQDLAEVKAHSNAGISGLLLGRSLYNGTLDAGKALALACA
ncbi:MAG: HisA/HisF-related TIM barrel protein [Bdellovibrionales bacterium]